VLVAVVGSLGPPRCLEAERCRNVGQSGRRQGAAKLDQPMGSVRVHAAGRRVRHEAGDGVEPCSDGANATAQPADGTRQGDVGTAQPVGGGLQAPGRTGDGDAVLDGVEQARHPGGQEVRQQAERPMPLRTIPSGNAHSPGCQARIAAMAREGAAA
jgi:hypothetical protein